ncbi:hypothetical protein [Nitrosomonas sp.]|uniref:hypothetical protein n=1 Tax=Nitrosomonas sp. TaxID=42353 RepID=UPI002083F827|nr:hypothetical protein [Nitrosomonas sp.]GJL75563.1 MAG: hypothetical protein NMNS02_16690 [Nitrosomonas sp.]
MTKNFSQFYAQLKAARQFSDVLMHPYLKDFEAGELPRPHIESVWSHQQACLSRSFSHCMGALFSKMPSDMIDEGKRLVDIICAETWDSKSVDNHHALFKKMIGSFKGLQTREFIVLDSTSKFVNNRQKFLMDSNIFRCLGILTENEFLNADMTGNAGIMVSYATGLQKMGYSSEVCEYAQAHVEEERHDVTLMLTIYKSLLSSPRKLSEMGVSRLEAEAEFSEGCNTICNLRVNFFDGLLESVF